MCPVRTSVQNQAFGYDGFGNLVSKSVPTGSSEFTLPGVNAAKNWLNGSTYDLNGNVTTLSNSTLSYDMENRLSSYTTGTFLENYAYDEGNRRVEKWSASADNVYFYGPNGKLLSVMQVNVLGSAPWVGLSTVTNRIYFGGMCLGSTTGYAISDADVIKDRLGSVQPSYAYGTDTGAGQQASAGGDDFATYSKDASTGFEYAMNRYYSAGYGRFLTADPFGGSASVKEPGSWNRYGYASGDPINRTDPSGRCDGGYAEICDGYCPPSAQYCSPGPPGTDYNINDPSQPNCGDNPQFVDGDTGETPNTGNGCGTPIVPPPPDPPQCDIKEQDAGVVAGKVHTYLDVTASDGTTYVLEGIQSNFLKSYLPIFHFTYLNGSKSVGGGVNIDHPDTDNVDYDSANQPGLSQNAICADASLLEFVTDNFPKNHVRYDLLGVTAPNSNSFIRYLSTFVADLDIVQPNGAIGWNHLIMGQ